jgi:hypothetical protein
LRVIPHPAVNAIARCCQIPRFRAASTRGTRGRVAEDLWSANNRLKPVTCIPSSILIDLHDRFERVKGSVRRHSNAFILNGIDDGQTSGDAKVGAVAEFLPPHRIVLGSRKPSRACRGVVSGPPHSDRFLNAGASVNVARGSRRRVLTTLFGFAESGSRFGRRYVAVHCGHYCGSCL